MKKYGKSSDAVMILNDSSIKMMVMDISIKLVMSKIN